MNLVTRTLCAHIDNVVVVFDLLIGGDVGNGDIERVEIELFLGCLPGRGHKNDQADTQC